MLCQDVEWPKSRRYKSQSEWEPLRFFSDGFFNASSFDLYLGFFSSAAINIMADGFAYFLFRGGHMRLIINDILSADDKKAILKGESNKSVEYFDLEDLDNLRKTLSERNKHFFECLSWLIRHEKIEIVVVSPQNGVGISHSKCGVFSDEQNKVAFEGSCNFSMSAIVQNIESFSIFCDWDNGGSDAARIKSIEDDFNLTFNGQDSAVTYVDAKDIRTRIAKVFPDKSLGDLLRQEAQIVGSRVRDVLSPQAKECLNRYNALIEEAVASIKDKEEEQESAPHFPFTTGPRDYQKAAFGKWKENNQRGLFSMATGTGKTLTALNCLLEIYNRKGYYKAIVLAPTLVLVKQWENECYRFGFKNTYCISSDSPKWRDDVQSCKARELTDEKASYVLISTYASFSNDSTFEKLCSFSSNKVLFIADEAHNMGGAKLLKKLPQIPYARRIGLSATPERQYDDEGNALISEFFGVKTKKYTFEYSMEEAIKNGVLCRYNYYPHVVELTDYEEEAYLSISRQLLKFIDPRTKKLPFENPIVNSLLLKRKRIIHKATNKLQAFKRIVSDLYKEKGTLRYTLVYAPEGDAAEEGQDDADSLIDEYTSIVRDVSPSTTVRRFTAKSSDRERILADFADGKTDVLTSMKCLDEGVDVPRSENAIFCASTGNPRQFVQRRGRILRKHPDKTFATIHDLVVVPKVSGDESLFNMERNLVHLELIRVANFAKTSENIVDSYDELRQITRYYNLSIFNQ